MKILFDGRQFFRTVFAEIIWIVIVCAVFQIHSNSIEKQTNALVKKEAITIFNKDLAFRTWATKHGGVYVPETELTPANPYLAHVPERDIVTPSGRKLTLMNPAYMLKQIMGDYSNLFGVQGHITSTNLMNPDNKPNSWEKRALEALEKGSPEFVEFSDGDGEPHIRFMRPLITKEGCLKCHAKQGYAEGDVRGAVGMSIPMTEYHKIESRNMLFIAKIYLAFGLAGALLIFVGFDQFAKRKKVQEESERALFQANELLESQVEERTAQLNQANIQLNENQRDLEKKVEERSSELLAAQESLNRHQKLSAIGKLAGTISHDLRNPLGNISNSIYFLRMKGVGSDPQIIKHLGLIEAEIEKTKKILSDTLDFSRADQLVLKSHDIVSFMERLIGLYSFPENIRCDLKRSHEKLVCRIDMHQLTMVVNNLIANAVQAMPEGGDLTITLIRNQQNLELHINDTGCGIEAVNLTAVYEPLFTTKNKGIGLGLATAREIIELHGGTINIHSEVGKGTEVVVCLPM